MSAKKTKTPKRIRYEIWQGGMRVAAGDGPEEFARKDAAHYAMMYSQDGPVEVKFKTPTAKDRVLSAHPLARCYRGRIAGCRILSSRGFNRTLLSDWCESDAQAWDSAARNLEKAK